MDRIERNPPIEFGGRLYLCPINPLTSYGLLWRDQVLAHYAG
jgi:hypothetical protein